MLQLFRVLPTTCWRNSKKQYDPLATERARYEFKIGSARIRFFVAA